MRRVKTYEGVVENGHVTLLEDVSLQERTRVYVLVPETVTDQASYVGSPRLVDPEKAKNFEKQVIQEATDADL